VRLAQGAGGAQQVVRDGGAGQPGAFVAAERAGRHVRERPAGSHREDLLHDRVVAVLALGMQDARTGSR